jgi:hypothetical protein
MKMNSRFGGDVFKLRYGSCAGIAGMPGALLRGSWTDENQRKENSEPGPRRSTQA